MEISTPTTKGREMMFWLAIYLILTTVFLLFWKSAHYRTPDEEARDIEEEAAYWREQAKTR